MLQIIGTKGCRETRKAIRFCKERSIAHQVVDLHQRALSDGEWESIFRSANATSLIDEESSYYRREGYAWREFDAEEELREHPELLKTPILRLSGRVAIGCNTQFLECCKET